MTTHLIKSVTKGLAETKCGMVNQSMFDVTAWWRDVTCSDCQPFEWKPMPPVGLGMVRKQAAPPATAKRRRIVRVPE